MTKIYLRRGAVLYVFPVTPAEIEVESEQQTTVYDTVPGGEVLHIGERRLRTVRWDGFFPARWAPYVNEGAVYGVDNVRMLEAMRDAREPLRLTIADLGISIDAAIASLTYGAEKGRDIPYSITLTEYKGVA